MSNGNTAVTPLQAARIDQAVKTGAVYMPPEATAQLGVSFNRDLLARLPEALRFKFLAQGLTKIGEFGAWCQTDLPRQMAGTSKVMGSDAVAYGLGYSAQGIPYVLAYGFGGPATAGAGALVGLAGGAINGEIYANQAQVTAIADCVSQHKAADEAAGIEATQLRLIAAVPLIAGRGSETAAEAFQRFQASHSPHPVPAAANDTAPMAPRVAVGQEPVLLTVPHAAPGHTGGIPRPRVDAASRALGRRVP